MRNFREVEELMAKLKIPYQIVEHPASYSTEESDKYIEGHEGCRSKTLVLANKKSTQFYMVIMDDSKRVEMNKLGEVLGVNRLHFASEERLESMLGLQPGIVSIYGLVDNKMDNMHVYFDREMLEEHDIMTFHPNDNTKTIFFPMEDCFKILESQGYTYAIIDF
ncbi:MAG TPA: prolyl-tRNA editing protein [Lactococcus sp.]|uniref:prolyl-tRNA synthetase associated domain-containing protein n=1 Tax=Lactococcus TaxID=1357 RepID=UPI000E862776|nr:MULTISPECIES: YbaK/EbsC family protein [Lactococcus]HAP15369.1 prolyl-tRNA editing protein [Lactococcus sp.]HBC91002.1 prolyl-tRNA editing protein [Lactococcus sp.]